MSDHIINVINPDNNQEVPTPIQTFKHSETYKDVLERIYGMIDSESQVKSDL